MEKYKSIKVLENYCPDGWKQHVDPLLEYLDLKRSKMNVLQIKEKFGHLRFYYDKAFDWEDDLIEYVTFLCNKTCQLCGSMKDAEIHVSNTGWYTTLCKECLNNLTI